MDKIISEIIKGRREKQGNSKHILRIEQLEKEVVAEIGSLTKYEENGGYRKLYDTVMCLKEQQVLQRLAKPQPNWKKPQLDETYWLMPKYVSNEWNKADIAKVMSYLDIGFYLRNKKYQTKDDWEKIEMLYEFLLSKDNHPVVSREERSLMLFKTVNLPKDIEPEKFLSSKYGQKLLNRLNLSSEDLRYQVVREPFHYWENKYYPMQHNREVLVIEGLSTYETLKEMLSNDLPWIFGPVPRYLIWGEGYRIHNTLDYLHEVDKNPEHLTIRYTGDIDYEGFNIYVELKNRYKELNLSLAHPFYSFLVSYMDEFSVDIFKKQRMKEKYIYFLQNEFAEFEDTFDRIKKLWDGGKRIPQECINHETILKKGR